MSSGVYVRYKNIRWETQDIKIRSQDEMLPLEVWDLIVEYLDGRGFFGLICVWPYVEGHYQGEEVYEILRGCGRRMNEEEKRKGREAIEKLNNRNRRNAGRLVFERAGCCWQAEMLVSRGAELGNSVRPEFVRGLYCRGGKKFVKGVKLYERSGGRMRDLGKGLDEYFGRQYARAGVLDGAVRFLMKRGLRVKGLSSKEMVEGDRGLMRRLREEGKEMLWTNNGWTLIPIGPEDEFVDRIPRRPYWRC
ncbi:uncharacterized protein BDW43DRAFT_266920 [Aspergillus alliaceus]|uniref:uncharacterized protein n=1 Tax=Petromyces alliaceus TaxID=209559 RepID=UPI0012A41307|nr:uncharacterized protein BDW43DRAFT_266920 [Aspergillus alliaceus]KAB8236433.1 hypothetical protein BDW43DRAFT_266920 [Aspergillus alliaceus]